MVTYEDMTGLFLKAAQSLNLTTHPEYGLNTRNLEREFACTCHTGTCEEAEQKSSCTVAFNWGTLDTALSFEGPQGVCEFFHEVEEDCQHLHMYAVPPLILDLSYSMTLQGRAISEEVLLTLAQALRLRASEQSGRTVETRPGITMILQDNRLQPEALTLQQRVEIPLWHPLGMHGLHDDPQIHMSQHTLQKKNETTSIETPNPEEWLPQTMVEVCQDIIQVLTTLDATLTHISDL